MPIGWDDELFDQDAYAQEAPGTSRRCRSRRAPVRTGGPVAPGEADDGKHKRRRGDKPRMPSWDDILLGVRHKND